MVTKKDDKKRKTWIGRTTLLLFSIAAIEFCITGLLWLYDIPSIKQTIVYATTIQPERFTELYFENHRDLPKNPTPFVQQSFAFTIHNLEYHTMTYHYEVSIQSKNEKQMIETGQITLKQNDYKTIHESFELTEQMNDAQVVVALLNKNEKIYFLLSTKKDIEE